MHLNLTKIFHLSNNLPWKFYVTTAPGFWILPFVILITIYPRFFYKDVLSVDAFPVF